ncbi:FixH family protein [Paenibacillus sp. PK3_47]|uniref:FixH family protein n=1 Tax=Paenibacillus sp. PK3_47 TaxID=2072642 RepID=UPI00201E7029|nr:FixH family protein [Paenibacillus sp. PK3_47]
MNKPKQWMALISIAAITVLGGCSGNNSEHDHMHTAADVSMEPIKVELSWSPADISVNQMVIFEAVVTQEGEPVDDAREVVFEIVNSGDETQKLELAGESAGNGTYIAEGSLNQEGTYKVTSHVTARTQHSMPSKELSVLP